MAGIEAVPPVAVSGWVGAREKGEAGAGGGKDGATRFQQQTGVKIVLMATERRWGIFARIDNNRSWHWTWARGEWVTVLLHGSLGRAQLERLASRSAGLETIHSVAF